VTIAAIDPGRHGAGTAAEALLAAFATPGPIEAPIAIVAAHPDDETIGLGAQLRRFRRGLLVHVTDGAPANGRDARARGFATAQDYAAARSAELAAALVAADAGNLRRTAFGVPDQQAWRDLAGLAGRIAELLDAERPHAVITHPYEGGHPDHDAAAFAVHAACRLLRSRCPPAIIEMASYHAGDAGLSCGVFLPGPGEILEIALGRDDRARKRRMFACFRTQEEVLAPFPIGAERFRPAPLYDFTRPPHLGALWYERLGWDVTGADWRRAAAAALTELGLDDRPSNTGGLRCR